MAVAHGMVSVTLLDKLLAKLPPKVALTPLVDKKPLRPNWQNETPLERDTLADLLLHGEDLPTKDGNSTWHCTYTGIGLRLGEISGGMVAVDHDGSSATQLIEQLAKTSIDDALPKTVSVTSGRHERYQVIYRIPSRYWSAISSRKILTGVKDDDGSPEQLEFRWHGQQSVLAGKHPLTGAYRFRPGMAPWEIEIAECPQWIIEQMLKDVPSDALPEWRTFDRNFRLPIPETVPLKICLSPKTRDILEGKFSRGRNDSGVVLSRDLVGTANYLDSISQRYDGNPEAIFMEWCREFGLDQDKPAKQPESIWRSTEKCNPEPSLPPSYIEGCIKSWLWKQMKSSSVRIQLPSKLLAEEQLDSPPKRRAKLAERHDQIKAAIGNQLRLNVLSQSIELNDQRMSIDEIQIALALDCNLDIPDHVAAKVIPKLAKENAYNPFVQYLQSVHAKHGNSGAELLEKTAAIYMGTTESLYQAYIKRTLIGAVARAMRPGCKLDTALILNGEQGYKKSSFFEKLLPNSDWFDDSMGDLGNKDELFKIHRACILEWAELESIFNRRGHSQIKSFLAIKIDRIRVPYGRNLEDYPRHSIIVGTTNQPEFLTDPTGDRRYWVVPVRQRIDLTRLEADRDLLWAAAVDAYLQGEQWWLTDAAQQESAFDNENYRTEHPWTTTVAAFVEFKTEVTASDVLTHIKPDIATQSKKDQMAVADVLTILGWRKGKITRNGRQIKGWKKVVPPSTTYDLPLAQSGTTLKPSCNNTFSTLVPPSTTLFENETVLEGVDNATTEQPDQQTSEELGEQIVLESPEVVLGGTNAQSQASTQDLQLVPPVNKVVLGGTRGNYFNIGERVWWNECPAHCSCFNPFTIYKIEGCMAWLEFYSEPVPLAELKRTL